jgi:TonB-linked SusC/RagA family outer membrane protein
MKKLLLFVCSIAFTAILFAQTRTITGRITDENGSPIPFATLKMKDGKTGGSADADGKFSFRIKGGEVFVVSAVGYLDKEFTTDANSVFTIALAKSTTDLKEVIVTTGLGIKKSARTTPYSAQVINSDNLTITRQANLNNSLAGKVAGVQTRSQSGAKLNSETFLRIRGGLGIGDRAAVYVVDGTIANSFDINPDDVEDVTVLKGANATALFGSQASGGAIVINTKKKSGGAASLGVEVNSGITFEKVYILPKYQNVFAGGGVADLTKFTWQSGMPDEWKALDGKYFHDYTDDASWGPRMVGQEYIPWYAWYPGHSRSFATASLLPQPSNNRDFWRTGMTTNNNVSFSKGAQGYNFRASYTNQYATGIIPNSNSDRHNLFLTGSADLNNHFTIATNMTFSSLELRGDFADGYANNAGANFNQWFHRDLDMNILNELKDLRSPFGTMATWNLRYNPDGFNPSTPENFYKANYWDNPNAYYAERPRVTFRNNMWGDASLTYKLNNEFRVKGTVRKNQLTTHFENIATSLLQNSGLQTGNTASFATGEQNIQRYDFELTGSFNKKFGDYAVSVTGGGNIFKYKQDDVTANTVAGINVPNLYAISNSKNPPTIGNIRRRQQINSVFASGDIEYKKIASVTFAVRNDWGSTLSELKPSLFYPSAGASFVFSEILKTKPSWFSFGKLFGSWGRKPESLDIYATNFTYGVNANQWNGNFLMGVPNVYPDPALSGALITTTEAGIDLRFLKNRLGFNFVYFHEVADKIPVSIPINGASGYTNTTINAAKVERSGFEIIMDIKPVMSKDFNWNINTTFAYLINNPVSKLFGDQTRIAIPLPPGQGAFGTRFAQAFQLLGEDWGQLYGNGLKRNASGIPVVNPASGLFLADPSKEYGSIVPKTTGGLVNTIGYKDFTLTFALDYQVGGKFFSLSESWGYFSGLFEETANINDKGSNVRDAIADGGGVHVVGVSSVDEKTPVDLYVDAQTYFHQFYNSQIAEPFVHDLTFVKLREVSLGYTIPIKKLGNISKYIQGARFSVISRNPWLIYADSKNFDPSEISNIYGEDGQLPGTRSLGVNLSIRF